MNETYAQPSMPEGVEGASWRALLGARAPYGFALRRPAARFGSDFARGDRGGGHAGRGLVGRQRGFSATSFSELAREAAEVERGNRLHPHATRRASHVARLLPGRAPIVAASDYVRAYPMLIAANVEARFVALGTDGFGRSDTRVQLRRFFEVDRRHIALAALQALVEGGTLQRATLAEAIKRYGSTRTRRRRGRAESGAALTKG